MPRSRHRNIRKPPRRGSQAHLMHNAARFPLLECLINEGWAEQFMASVSFARSRPDGSVAVAAFAVDLGCLGVKSAFAQPEMSVVEYRQRIARGPGNAQLSYDPACAVKLIKGAVRYAKAIGFSPDPDYYFAKEIFGDIDPDECHETIEYGQDGKPLYVAGPYDNVNRIMNQLKKKLGPDGFNYILEVTPTTKPI